MIALLIFLLCSPMDLPPAPIERPKMAVRDLRDFDWQRRNLRRKRA